LNTAAPVQIIPLLLFLCVYAFIFFAVWKFYQVLSRMNDNLAGIRRAIERTPPPSE
jgi:hypothetical protein